MTDQMHLIEKKVKKHVPPQLRNKEVGRKVLLEDIKNPHPQSDDNDRVCNGYYLNPRQKIFCDAYLRTGNLTLASKEAGYTSCNSRQRLLHIPAVKEYLQKKTKIVHVSKNWYVSKLSTVIEGGIPEENIPEEERQFTTRDALTAGDQLCKLSGFYEPEKRININANLEDMKALMAKIKEKERGF